MKSEPHVGGRKRTPGIDRLLARVEKTENGCWLYRGSGNSRYGSVWHEGKPHSAHRLAYETLVGPIPEGLQIDHLCRKPRCVNPEHLEPVTAWTNTMRSTAPSARNALKTHCPQGHPYDAENTLIRTNGRRKCRECGRIAFRAWSARKRAERAA